MPAKPKLNPYLKQILEAREKRAKAPICKPGTHKLQVVATCGTTSKMLNCKVCSFGVDVPLNAKEIKAICKEDKRQKKETEILHDLVWKYQEKFYFYDKVTLDADQWKAEKERVKRLNKGSKHKIFKAHRVQRIHNGFKWSGYELMQQFEKFAKEHPEVTICGCDDAYHASSDIVLIPHRTPSQYWGTTVIIVPQMGPFPPTEVFLYPSHSQGLVEALSAIVKEASIKAETETMKSYCPDTSIPKWFKAEGL